jgi:(S)-3,5-dihydroxyphenylglycine transaminase
MTLARQSLNPALVGLDAMNFLNEITMRFPDAISFAPGRPFEPLFSAEASLVAVRSFAAHRSSRPLGVALDALAQYGRTKGIICDLVAEMLRRDEQIDVSDESIIVTVGSQEAGFVALSTLYGRHRSDQILLVADPSYVGVSGAARVLGIEMWPVRSAGGLDLGEVERLCRKALREGQCVRALYVIPDFSNPLGVTMPLPDRTALLELSLQYDFLIIEDNAYGMFAFEGQRLPTLKALDRSQRVIYLGTFSKLIYPGIRVGFAVADQSIDGGSLLADEMAKVKSMTTVNTSPIAQGIVGGVLLDNGCSLAAAIRAKVQHYRRNRDRLLQELRESFATVDGVKWNEPKGGFFLTLEVPFSVDDDALLESASTDGVLWVPMRYFYLGGGGESQMRLSFSGLEEPDIARGVERLAGLLRRKQVARAQRVAAPLSR